MTDITKRFSRIISILIHLQTKKIITATELSQKFSVSIRTIYRDIKSLENAGVPILTEEGKGYYLMDGYKIPPVMFTEAEANALITAEKIVLKTKDLSFRRNYTDAITKIKAVLQYQTQEKVNFLSNRIAYISNRKNEQNSDILSILQLTITNYQCVEIEYFSTESQQHSKRNIEPFALYNTNENWVLVAFCRLRSAFRAFRLDRIISIRTLDERFKPHQITLQQYFENCKK